MVKETMEVIKFSDAEKIGMKAVLEVAEAICYAEDNCNDKCPFFTDGACHQNHSTEVLTKLMDWFTTHIEDFEETKG